MADLSTLKQAVGLEQHHFREICWLKTFGVERKTSWYVKNVVYCSQIASTSDNQTHKQATVTLMRMC